MSTEKGLDILGIKPVAEAFNKLTTGTVDGASAFLSRICLPAAEEFGLLLRDKVHGWRANNIESVSRMAQAKLIANCAPDGVHSHPRLVNRIIEEGSWTHDSEVQEMWAGLLASSCTQSGDDESNLIFITLLSRLTQLQVKILNYACQHVGKVCSTSGLIHPQGFLQVTKDQLYTISGEDDLQRLDRELDYLRSLDLLLASTGFNLNDPDLPLFSIPAVIWKFQFHSTAS